MTNTNRDDGRRFTRTVGRVAVVVVLATAMVVEPWLQSSGYGVVALAIYALTVLPLLWALSNDIRRIRA
ncbi:hypothetical protein BRD04_09350 [Halobacteriales archaeon QS_9_67_17]|nr:MAG: hypothetical protein BRD04_09350 [Halobacteriales archaeon QS_9_67_17]